ncbi:MAG: efflux RND transporter periplasmic adaptor subunit [Planctomycetota bacterium]
MKCTERVESDSIHADPVSLCGRLLQSIKSSPDHSQLLESVANFVAQSPSCRLLFYVSAIADGNLQSSPAIKVLHSTFQTLPKNLESWATVLANQAITYQQPRSESLERNGGVSMFAVPVSNEIGDATALVGLFVGENHKSDANMFQIQSAANAIEQWHSRELMLREQKVANDLAAVNEIARRLDTVKSLTEMAKVLANDAANYLASISGTTAGKQQSPLEADTDGEDKLCVGIAEKTNVSLEAISNWDSLPTETSMVEAVESAMAEAFCRNSDSQWPTSSTESYALLCHQSLLKNLRAANVFSILTNNPLGPSKLVLTYITDQSVTTRQRRFLRVLLDTLDHKIDLIRRSESGKIQKAIDQFHQWRTSKRKKFVLGVIAAIILVSLIPWPYRIGCVCESKPKLRRLICAPFDTKLENCFVDPGDTVEAGQLLGKLDDKDLRLELAQNRADLDQARNSRDGYLASHESGEARLAELETQKLMARNQLLRNQIHNLELRSPIDGVVVSGELKDAIGVPFDQGDSMFEIAPLDEFVIELLIPEDDIRYAQKGMPVVIQFKSIPFRSFAGEIVRVQPESQIRDAENVFVALASLQNAPNHLSPGMTGFGKIKSVWRPVAWNWLHKPAAKGLRWFGW